MSRQKNLEPYIHKMSDKQTDPKLTGQFAIYDTMRKGVIPRFNSKEKQRVFEKTLDVCRSSEELSSDPEAEMQKFLSANAKNSGSTEGSELEAAIPVDAAFQPSFGKLDGVEDLESFHNTITARKKSLIAKYGRPNRYTLEPTKEAARVFKSIVTTCETIEKNKAYSRIKFLLASIYTTATFHNHILTHHETRRGLISGKRSAINQLVKHGLVTDECWSSRMFWTTLYLRLTMDYEAIPAKEFFAIYNGSFKWLKYIYKEDSDLKDPIIDSLSIIFWSFHKFNPEKDQKYVQNKNEEEKKKRLKDKLGVKQKEEQRKERESKNVRYLGKTKNIMHSKLKDHFRKLNIGDLYVHIVGSGYLSITDDQLDSK
jgi:hypothetical protein